MIRANATKQLTRLILLLVLPSMSCLAEQIDQGAETPSAVTTDREGERAVVQEVIKKPGRPRLKYRNGPVCMCNGGLSEEDIHAAWIKRFLSANESEQ